MPQMIALHPEGLNPSTYAIKAWINAAIFRLHLYPKAIYLHPSINVDQSTWSRWTSLEHDQTPPSGILMALVALFEHEEDTQDIEKESLEGLIAILTPPKKQATQRRMA
jgi:hypothetical protein